MKNESVLGKGNEATVSKPLEELDTDSLRKLITDEYEAVHLDQLPKLHRLARKIETVHRTSPDLPRGVTLVVKHLGQLVVDHSQHDGAQAISPIKQDHDEIRAQLRELRELTDSYQAPDTACRSWRRFYTELKSLDFSLSEQIDLEQNILLPRFQS